MSRWPIHPLLLSGQRPDFNVEMYFDATNMSREEYNELTNWPSDKGSRTGILCNVVRNDLGTVGLAANNRQRNRQDSQKGNTLSLLLKGWYIYGIMYDHLATPRDPVVASFWRDTPKSKCPICMGATSLSVNLDSPCPVYVTLA